MRHRLKILDRLHRDILKGYGEGERDRVKKITIEVNRDLREFSGKTAKQIAQDMGLRLNNFKNVTEKLEKMLEGKNIAITPGLIRKARIAEDHNWTCPYTGKPFDVFDLIHRRVDKDHVIPRSQRPSDSLDSLVITFNEVNRMKGKRTALRFIEEAQGREVPGMGSHIKSLATYVKDVEGLEAFKGHDDDKKRKRNRKRLLLLAEYVEKEFVPRDLTQTSQLVRLGAQALQKTYVDCRQWPVITSMPGSVTGTARRSWDLLGCLSVVNPAITKETTKTEVRGMTHLHHALDACVLAFASLFLPRDGGAWELLSKRRLSATEQTEARRIFKDRIVIDQEGGFQVRDLPPTYKEQIRRVLAERRVVQHIPRDMSGMMVKETVWRVVDPTDNHPNAQRIRKWLRGAKVEIPAKEAKNVLLISRKRRGENDKQSGGKVFRETKTWSWSYELKDRGAVVGLEFGKLVQIKGAKILDANYGLALEPEPTTIRHFKVWHELQKLQRANQGRPVRVLRKGTIIKVPENVPNPNYRGLWMVRGVSFHQKKGLLIDLSPPDRIVYRRQPGCLESVSVKTLLKYGIVICNSALCGAESLDRAK